MPNIYINVILSKIMCLSARDLKDIFILGLSTPHRNSFEVKGQYPIHLGLDANEIG